MPKLIMCKGLPASGKTTWARTEVRRAPTNSIKRVNKDDLRAMLDDGQWSKGNEQLVLDIRDFIVEQSLIAGKHVIVDDTNLAPKHEDWLRKLAKKHGAVFHIQDFTHIDKDECIKRDATRLGGVSEKVIHDMWKKFLAKDEVPAYIIPQYDPNKKPAIICDIDGTLAHNNGHRGWYEYDKVGDDKLFPHIRKIVNNISFEYDIILVSGREDSCEQATRNWLHAHAITFDRLLMRKTGDHRADNIIKKEIYEQHIEPDYNILFVLDDRDRVVNMWRNELGIPCLQVAPGDF
jgi:predicted kinase